MNVHQRVTVAKYAKMDVDRSPSEGHGEPCVFPLEGLGVHGDVMGYTFGQQHPSLGRTLSHWHLPAEIIVGSYF